MSLISQLSQHLDLGDLTEGNIPLGFHEVDPEENVYEDTSLDEIPTRIVFTAQAMVGESCVGKEKVKVKRKSPLSDKIFEVVEWKEIWDDNTKVSDPYFTSSGNRPVVESIVDQVSEKRSAGGFNILRPSARNRFYSAAIPWKKQERTLHSWMSRIWVAKTDSEALSQLWKEFWRTYYSFASKRERAQKWLFTKQVKLITGTFRRFRVKK